MINIFFNNNFELTLTNIIILTANVYKNTCLNLYFSNTFGETVAKCLTVQWRTRGKTVKFGDTIGHNGTSKEPAHQKI